MRTVSVWAAPTWEGADSSAVLFGHGASQHLAQPEEDLGSKTKGRIHTSRGRAAGSRGS